MFSELLDLYLILLIFTINCFESEFNKQFDGLLTLNGSYLQNQSLNKKSIVYTNREIDDKNYVFPKLTQFNEVHDQAETNDKLTLKSPENELKNDNLMPKGVIGEPIVLIVAWLSLSLNFVFAFSCKECDNRVHRKCLQVKFNDEEVENVRLYLMQRFQHTKPIKPICKQLFVRKDVKCLTKYELLELIEGFKELYKRGIMDRYSLIHAAYWPAAHKFAEGIPWHRWHVRQLEKELQRINPKLSMPYWESYSEFAAPERSNIWDFLGTAGYPSNSFCIPDGAFAYQRAQYPRPHCITRQWRFDGTIPSYEAPEWVTSATQLANDWPQYVQLIGYTGHFKLHLSLGGFYGDYSIPWATNDPLFYIFHAFPTDLVLLKWQLSDDRFLVPQSYTGANRLLTRSQRIVAANVETDTLSFYSNIRVKEAFQVGFGELCYIHDQLIRPINDLMHKIEREYPIAIKTLMDTLPKASFDRYFPKFAAKNATFFDHFLPDVGHCPTTADNCKTIPIALRYNSTANGLRQLERFRFDAGIDLTPLVFQTETIYYQFMNELRQYRYCSPYVT